MSYLEDFVELNKRLYPAPWRLVEREGRDKGYSNYFFIEDADGLRVVDDGSMGGEYDFEAYPDDLEDIVTLRNNLPELLEELEREKRKVEWLCKYYALLDNPIPCPYLAGSFDQTKPCPYWKPYYGEMPEDNSLKAWKDLLTYCDDVGEIDCGTPPHECLLKAAEEAAKKAMGAVK